MRICLLNCPKGEVRDKCILSYYVPVQTIALSRYCNYQNKARTVHR